MKSGPSMEPAAPTEDIFLARLAQRGDVDSFNVLVERYQKGIYNFAFRMLRGHEAAEDATQDTFVSAYSSIKGFRGGNFRSWLYKIAANTCYDVLRRKKRYPTAPLEAVDAVGQEGGGRRAAASPEDSAMTNERLRYISDALVKLPQEQRLVLVLFDIQGFSYQEISETTQSSLGTVKSRLSRAREKFRDLILEAPELFPEFPRLNLQGRQ